MISKFSNFMIMAGTKKLQKWIGFRYAWVLIASLVLLLLGCTEDEVKPRVPSDPRADYQKEVIDYFVEVALGFEFGTASKVTRKWKIPIKVFIGGDKSSEMLNELDRIIIEIEELAGNLSISITEDSLQSNYYLFLGPGSTFAQRFPPAQSNISSNWGLFYVYFNGANEIYKGVMYVDTERATQAAARKHLLREEFTQSLGLARDSNVYPLSIFYSPWTLVTEFTPIDRDLIRLLYHSDMKTGYDESATRLVLKDLVKKINIGA